MSYQCLSFVPTHHGETFFRWKNLLNTCGWVMKGSSDGLTFDTTGTVDKVATGYGTGAGNTNNAYCWFVLEQPSSVGYGRRQFLFEKKSTTDASLWRVAYSLVGFDFVAASATVAPTATDVREAQNYASPNVAGFAGFAPFQAGSYRMLIGADNASPSGMWAVALATATPYLISASGGYFLFDPLATGSYTAHSGGFGVGGVLDGDVGDLDGYALGATYSTTSNTEAFDYSKWVMGNSSMKAWLKYSSATGNNVFQRYKLMSVLTHAGYGAFNVMPSDPYTGKDPTLPLWYINDFDDNSRRHVKGVSTLLRLNLTSRATGDTLSTTSTRDRIVLGDFSVPWNGTVPVL